MKRMPLLMSLLALIALSVSCAYWAMQLYKPAQRPLAAAPMASQPDPAIDAAAQLFGGQSASVASNYQLTGVVAAGRDSAAIIVVDNGAPLTLKVGKEVVNGLRVQEVHPRFVLLSDGRRIEMAADVKPAGGAQQANQPNQPMPQQMQPQPVQPVPQVQQPGQASPIQVPMQPSMTGAPQNNQPVQNVPPPQPVQMAPPVRSAPAMPGMTGQSASQ